MFKKYIEIIKHDALFIIGLLIFAVLNIFSASTMELHFDEAYYWLYSQHPALGYFDHPPFISWLILAGSYVFPGELGIRIFSILLSVIAMSFLWRMVKKYSPNPILFWLLIYSVVLIHPYSFVATPDAPLFCFSVIFFYYYKKYLDKNSFQNVVILSLITALCIYSKYHSLLILFFIILSFPALLKKFSFWSIFIIVIIYLTPHIIWQIDNGLPTINYHLIDSHKTAYRASVTFDYIISELAVTGPILGWLFLYSLFVAKPSDKWEKGLKYAGIGTFIFFLISTFGGDFEAHWTLIAMTPLIIFSYKYITEKPHWQKWVKIAGIINFSFLLIVRFLIITPLSDNIQALKLYTGNQKEAETIKKFAGTTPVLFQDTWTKASLYAYYSNNKLIGNLNSSLHRKNQFDFYDNDERLKGNSVFIFSLDSTQFDDCDVLKTNKSTWYIEKIGSFSSYYNLTFDKPEFTLSGDSLKFNTVINNPYNYNISLNLEEDNNCRWQLYTRKGRKWIMLSENALPGINLDSESHVNTSAQFTLNDKIKESRNLFLTLTIGDLKPIPVKWKIKIKDL